MFKDKVKVTVVALVMVLLMVLSITTDLFVGLADVFRAKAEEATPTDATPVTRDVTVYKELNDSDKDKNLAGAVIKVFKDSACTESITEFVLSYDGKSYGGDDRVVYKSLEERANANASKAIAKLQEDTYYYQLDKKLFRSNDDYSKTGYDYNNTVGSFSIVAGDGVQEIKLDNNMFRPTEKVATPTDASSEVSTEVTTEAVTEPDTQVATTSDASSEETEATTQIATPTDSIPEVKPVATLASVMRAAGASYWIYGDYSGMSSGDYHVSTDKDNVPMSGNASRVFCGTASKQGPGKPYYGSSQGYTRRVVNNSSTVKVLSYYYDVLAKQSDHSANWQNHVTQTAHALSYINGYGASYKPSWWSAAMARPVYSMSETQIYVGSNTTTSVVNYTSSEIHRGNREASDGLHTLYNVQWTAVKTVSGTSLKNYFTVKVPSNVRIYVKRNNGKWGSATNTDVNLYSGDKFFFTTSKLTDRTTTIANSKAALTGFTAYAYDPVNTKNQTMYGNGVSETRSIQFSIPWKDVYHKLTLDKLVCVGGNYKVDASTAGTQYTVYWVDKTTNSNRFGKIAVFEIQTNGKGKVKYLRQNNYGTTFKPSGFGTYTLDGLPTGVYRIVETKTNDGFETAKPCRINFSNGAAVDAEGNASGESKHFEIAFKTNDNVKNQVANFTSFEQKESGDPLAIKIQKIDADTKETVGLGSGSLAGAEFTIKYYEDAEGVGTIGISVPTGTPTARWVIKTDEDGYASLANDEYIVSKPSKLPDSVKIVKGKYNICKPGTIVITESEAPKNYNKFSKVTTQAGTSTDVDNVVIRADYNDKGEIKLYSCKKDQSGKLVKFGASMTGSAIKIYEPVKRYNLRLQKTDGYEHPMANVAFVITCRETGESHVMLTDSDGILDTSRVVTSGGKFKVNANDDLYEQALTDNSIIPEYVQTSVFFNDDSDVAVTASRHSEGALYAGTYIIRELHRQYVTVDGEKCKLSEVYKIPAAIKVTVPGTDNNAVGEHDTKDAGTMTNIRIPSISSVAMDADSATKMSITSKDAKFRDIVTIHNPELDKTYTLMSIAVDTATGLAYVGADGQYVRTTEYLGKGSGLIGADVPLELTANTTGTEVNQLTFFEYLVEGKTTNLVGVDSDGKPVEPAKCVAKDASVSNKAQTVNVISLETEVLVNSTKTNESPAAISTVTDTVTTHGLIAGESFTINSTIKVDGKSIGVQSTDFTADGKDKEVSVVFKDLDLSKLANKRLSIVTELIYKNKVILTHNDDGKDLNEEFYTPEMHSNAIDVDTLTKMSKTSETAKFKDTVDIKNLSAATQYTLQSIAVDTATGLAYKDASGKYVVGHETFTTKTSKDNDRVGATADIEFTANTKDTNVTQITFYEYLVRGSVDSDISVDENGYPVRPANWIAEDASTSNVDQTLNLVNLETKVLVDSTKTNVAPADKKVDVTDTVTLHNLVAGTKFTLVGKVSDGENIKVENEVEFTAKGGDETVSVPFKSLDLTKYAGKSLYVICELKYDGEVIATHNEDGTDPDEVFYVPAVETNAIDATTNTQYSILDKTQIIDSVKYSNLPTEYEYELETTFVDSTTGEEIKKTEIEKDPYWGMLRDLGYVTDETSSDSTGDSVAEDTGKIVSEVGKAFKRTQVLKPEKMDDMINVAFDIDPRSFNLEGKTITIQQVIKLNGVVVAKHTDKDAESQQISFPTGSTLAVDNTSHNHTIAPTKNADVVDTIFCKNLATGISVDFYGIAIDKDTNKPVELNGKPVVVKQNETISKADQEVQLHYVVDGTKLKGKRLTSFVFAVYNGKIVFKHTDLNSAEQSFSFSSLRTKFLDDKNGTHATMLTEDVHQTDTVTLDGLTKGEGFTLKGVVYNKSTRKPMLVNGKQVTNSIDFTAKGNSEEVALKYQYNGLKSDAYHKDKNDDLVSFVYLYKDGVLIDKEEDFDSFDQTIKLPSCGTSASDGITKLHVGYASKTAIFRDSVDYYNLIVGDWYSTTLTLHLNKNGKDAGPLKDANGNLITATVKFQAKTTDGSVKVEVKYDASLLAGETITAFETIRTKGYEVCGHTEITDKGQQIHYPELKTSAKNSKDNSQHVKEGEVAKIVDTVNYSKLDSSVAYKVVTEAWDYNTQQIVVSDGKKVRKVTELHVDSKKPENGSFDVSMSFKTDGLGKHKVVIFEYVYDNKGNLISKEADFDAESQTIYIDKTPNKTGDRTAMFLSILVGMLGLGVVTLFVTRRKKK